jgi:hypothetical protein
MREDVYEGELPVGSNASAWGKWNATEELRVTVMAKERPRLFLRSVVRSRARTSPAQNRHYCLRFFATVTISCQKTKQVLSG